MSTTKRSVLSRAVNVTTASVRTCPSTHISASLLIQPQPRTLSLPQRSQRLTNSVPSVSIAVRSKGATDLPLSKSFPVLPKSRSRLGKRFTGFPRYRFSYKGSTGPCAVEFGPTSQDPPQTHADLIASIKDRIAWDKGPSDQRRDFERDGPPEDLEEISLFVCSKCGQ